MRYVSPQIELYLKVGFRSQKTLHYSANIYLFQV